MRDTQGRDGLRFVVPADGDPVAEVVDVDGHATSFLSPSAAVGVVRVTA